MNEILSAMSIVLLFGLLFAIALCALSAFASWLARKAAHDPGATSIKHRRTTSSIDQTSD